MGRGRGLGGGVAPPVSPHVPPVVPRHYHHPPPPRTLYHPRIPTHASYHSSTPTAAQHPNIVFLARAVGLIVSACPLMRPVPPSSRPSVAFPSYTPSSSFVAFTVFPRVVSKVPSVFSLPHNPPPRLYCSPAPPTRLVLPIPRRSHSPPALSVLPVSRFHNGPQLPTVGCYCNARRGLCSSLVFSRCTDPNFKLLR